jgi:hypothetical protein
MRCALGLKGDRFATPEEWRREDAPKEGAQERFF